jgi:hypothetical protein
MYLEKQKEGSSSKSDAEEYVELFELCMDEHLADNHDKIKELLGFDEDLVNLILINITKLSISPQF